jgi:hypothetical protein
LIAFPDEDSGQQTHATFDWHKVDVKVQLQYNDSLAVVSLSVLGAGVCHSVNRNPSILIASFDTHVSLMMSGGCGVGLYVVQGRADNKNTSCAYIALRHHFSSFSLIELSCHILLT